MLAAVMLLSVTLMGMVAAADEANEQVIIGFKESLGKPDRESLIKEHRGKVLHSYGLINAAAARIPSRAMVAIEKNPNVKYVEYDYIVTATVQSLPWGVDRIDAPIVHGYNKGGGIKVAIIDTGIDHDHPDLHANCIGGIDYVNDDNDPMDDNGHGTHCAGIIGAMDNDIGVIGVAPEASLCGVKVLDSGGRGSYSDVIAGIEWSVNNGMQVISMSLGGDSHSQALQDACDAAYDNGVLLVAAAGNDGWWRDSVDYPARYDSVIAVAATDSNDNRPYWSSQGPAVELAAPGVSIHSTYWNNIYATKSGTSMACPHVTGAAALVMASDPPLSNVAVRERLQTTADDLGAPGRDALYGFGLVDAAEAAPPSGDDTTGPITSGVLADPNPASGAASVTLTADIDDSTTGSSNIAQAEYFVGTVDADGTGTAMNAADGAFNSPTEDVTAAIDVSGWSAGSYTLYVHGRDAAGNWGVTELVVLAVTGAPTNTMHVDSIDMTLNCVWVFYYATAMVTTVDATNNPVEGATVSGHWEDATSDHDSGVTNSNGQTPLLQSNYRWSSSGTTFTFVVDNVAKEGWEYNPGANEETEDSVTVQ
jgi:subtilisin family serine protease